MRYAAEHKAQTRDKIVKAACRCFKQQGLDGAGVADIMKVADLTHGGFYGHFTSKDALAAEAIRESLHVSLSYLRRWGGGARAGQQPLHVIIDNYLSIIHRDNVPTGCPMPLLSADIARSGRNAQSALTAKLKEIIDALEQFAAAARPRDQQTVAIGVLAGIVGGMLLARATDDKARSDQILAATAAFLKQAVAPRKARAGRRGRAG